MLNLHFHTVELNLTQHALGPTDGAAITIEQANLRARCVQSIRDWFDGTAAISTIIYSGRSFPFLTNDMRCLSELLHLAEADEPGWDKNAVMGDMDPLIVMDRVIRCVEQVIGSVEESFIFERHKQVFGSVRNMYEAKLRKSKTPEMQEATWENIMMNELFTFTNFDHLLV